MRPNNGVGTKTDDVSLRKRQEKLIINRKILVSSFPDRNRDHIKAWAQRWDHTEEAS